MSEKIDKFIDKYLNWQVFKNVLIAQLCLIPHSCIISIFNIPIVLLIIMDISFGLSVAFLTKAIHSIKREGV